MIKKIFLLTLVVLIGGCTNLVKNPTDIKKSFVQIRKSVEVHVCGENDFSKTNECKKLMTLRSTGSGSVVWNEYYLGAAPRTLILTAEHVCASEEMKFEDFDVSAHMHIKNKMGFSKKVEIVTKPKMTAVNSEGVGFPIKKRPWASNVHTDTCVLETSMNAPILNIGTKPEYGENVVNIAAPNGIYFTNKSGGGVFYTEGFYNGEFVMDTNKIFSMYNIVAAPGSSGSPVLNQNGEIIGMVHSIDSRYCNLITSQCNSPVTYSATIEQVEATIKAALAAIKRGDAIRFDYSRIKSQ